MQERPFQVGELATGKGFPCLLCERMILFLHPPSPTLLVLDCIPLFMMSSREGCQFFPFQRVFRKVASWREDFLSWRAAGKAL